MQSLIRRSTVAFCLIYAVPFLFSTEELQPFRLGVILQEIEAKNKIPPTSLDTTGLESKLQEVLQGYFNRTLGGEANWKKIDTLLTKGVITLPNGEAIRFINYRKKPDLNKIILYLPNNYEIIQSYDGEVAWELLTFESSEPSLMSEGQSVDFIRDSCFGSHLVYPLLPNKTILTNGYQLEEEPIAYLDVELPNKQRVKIGINASGQQVFEETVNIIDGAKRLTLQSDFRKIDRVVVPFESSTYIDGNLIQQVSIESAVFNEGIYGWMFKMPSP